MFDESPTKKRTRKPPERAKIRCFIHRQSEAEIQFYRRVAP